MTKFTQNASTYIADSGSLAEEVFSSIRTAQAFGAQKTLADLFDAYVKKASVVGIKGARISSLGLAVMFFVIYSGYALAFFYGAILVSRCRSLDSHLATWLSRLTTCYVGVDQPKSCRRRYRHHRLLEYLDR